MTNFNQQFTQLIRASRPAYWGNWALSSQIQPGAVGMIDPASGEFKLVNLQLPGISIKETLLTQTWKLSSENVQRQENSLGVAGSGTDPNTGIQVKAETEVKWSFKKAGGIVSEFSVHSEKGIEDLTAIHHQYAWLAEQAKYVNMGSDGKIHQGFGVITNVIYANSGLNIGTVEKESSFAIDGSVEGMSAMLGDKGPKVGVKGSYLSCKTEKKLDSHIWPKDPSSEPATPMPIAFDFVSFEEDLLIPNWIKNLGSFEIFFKNLAGCTYICRVKLAYDSAQGRVEEAFSISGGLSRTVGNIPLDAKNIKVDIEFVGMFSSDKYSRHWANPLGQWLNGQRHINFGGVWPGRTKVQVEEEPDK